MTFSVIYRVWNWPPRLCNDIFDDAPGVELAFPLVTCHSPCCCIVAFELPSPPALASRLRNPQP